MALPDKYRLLSPHFVEREINGETFKFFPVSLGASAPMADMISELSRHFSVIFSDTNRDQGSTHEEMEDPDGATMKKTTVQPINPDLAMIRIDKRSAAVQKAIETLVNPKYRLALGELLMNSLREDFPREDRKSRKSAETQDWIDSLELPTFIEFLKGLAEANAEVFGAMGKSLKDALGGQVTAALEGLAASEEPATAG